MILKNFCYPILFFYNFSKYKTMLVHSPGGSGILCLFVFKKGKDIADDGTLYLDEALCSCSKKA